MYCYRILLTIKCKGGAFNQELRLELPDGDLTKTVNMVINMFKELLGGEATVVSIKANIVEAHVCKWE